MLRRLSNDFSQMCELMIFLLENRLYNLIREEMFESTFRSACDDAVDEARIYPDPNTPVQWCCRARPRYRRSGGNGGEKPSESNLRARSTPQGRNLSAEAMHWASEALNHTACTSNPDHYHRTICGLERQAQSGLTCFSTLRTATGSASPRRSQKLKAAFTSGQSGSMLIHPHQREGLRVLERWYEEHIISSVAYKWRHKGRQ